MLSLFKNKIFILTTVTLALLITIGLSLNQNSKVNWVGNILSIPLSPVQDFFSFTCEKIEDGLSFFKNTKIVLKENEELKQRIEQLENENRQLQRYKKESEDLKEALNFKDLYNSYEPLGANIIAKDLGNWFNVFNINRGLKDGIAPNFPVITNKGLVGKVSTSWPFSSKVLSIIDEYSSVSAIVTKTRDYVLVKGDLTLKNQGLCRISFLTDGDVSVGDTIETSGIGGVFPKGILIGKVKQIVGSDTEFNRYAILEPAVDFKRLEEVIVLKNKNIKDTETGSAVK